MKKLTEKNKSKLKWVLSIVSIVLSVITLVALCVGLGNLAKTETLGNTDYGIGTINETGKVIESRQSAYTKNDYSTDGMIVELDEETATITYKLAFYDKDGKFVSMTEALDKDFDTTNIPSSATTFKVVITPLAVDGEPVELNIFNVGKYTSQLKVTVNK